MRFNRGSLRFTLRPVHFPLYWQWVLIIFKPPLFTFSPFTWCLICTFLYHISHDCGSISHTKPKTMDDPTSLVSLDNSCGAGWLSAHSSYYSPRSRGRRGTVEMADLTEYFRFDWIFSGAVLAIMIFFLLNSSAKFTFKMLAQNYSPANYCRRYARWSPNHTYIGSEDPGPRIF